MHYLRRFHFITLQLQGNDGGACLPKLADVLTTRIVGGRAKLHGNYKWKMPQGGIFSTGEGEWTASGGSSNDKPDKSD